ncbi:MAG: HlyD family secretion protein [Acidobacteriaceae bacterium]|jgi:HlyD family secretion protein|nr:HlyD family secretion protein [Acidobacteriaceae bacterium]
MDQRKLRNRILLFLVVAGIVAYVLVRLSGREPVAKIAAVMPVRDNLVSSISSNGKVEPISPFVMRAPLDTFVEKVTGVEGQQVKKGQLLLELNVRDARAQLDDAEARLLRARDELRAAQSGGKPDEAARIAGDLAKAQGDRDRLLRNHDALERLIAKQAATRDELAANDLSSSNAQAEVKRLSAAKQEFERGVKLDAGRTSLQVQQVQGEIASLRAKVASARITAPTDGTLYALPVKTGDYVKTGDLLAEMADLHRVRVRAFIDEPELGGLVPNEPVKITWDALPNRVWTGRTEVIPKQVVPHGTRSVGELLCAVDNQKLELLPNINVDVKIHSNERTNVLTVPRAAVDAESGHRYVFVVTKNALGKSRLSRRELQLGIADSTNFEVVSGLQENEMVALPGDAVLHDGMAVKIVNTDSAYVRGHSDGR